MPKVAFVWQPLQASLDHRHFYVRTKSQDNISDLVWNHIKKLSILFLLILHWRLSLGALLNQSMLRAITSWDFVPYPVFGNSDWAGKFASIFCQAEKNCGCQMVTHLSILLGLDFITSLIWPFTLTALMFVLCIIEAFNWRILLSLCEKKTTMFTAHPSSNGQHLHNTSQNTKL